MSESVLQGLEGEIVVVSAAGEVAAPEEIAVRPERTWGCPACSYAAATAEELAAHLRFIHVTPLFSEDSAPAWKCPVKDCRRAKRAFPSARAMARHLDLHALAALGAPRRRRIETVLESQQAAPMLNVG